MAGIYWETAWFYAFALLACGFALAVVFASSIVRMAFYLVLCLASTAGLFFLAGADFVGAMQLMIYVGGTLVLLIFGVMLTSQAQFVKMRTGSGELLIAFAIGAALFALLAGVAMNVPEWRSAEGAISASTPPHTATPLAMGLLGARVDRPLAPDAAGYLLVFEIVSVHLLVVLVGAAYLARAKRRRISAE